MKAPKERPILFSGEMVRAILEGRKTQTRRIVKHIPSLGWPENWCHRAKTYRLKQLIGDYRRFCGSRQPGDGLWVREKWRTVACLDYLPPRLLGTRSPVQYADMSTVRGDQVTKYSMYGKWRSSIHMPRWASRITLEIVNVRVERLQDISEEDAKAAGSEMELQETLPNQAGDDDPWYTGGFINTWNYIHGPGSWDANPWVWVIEFRRVDP